MNTGFLGPTVATVLTVYGIETGYCRFGFTLFSFSVATVLTVYGIETYTGNCNIRVMAMLQQYLPFTVLKRSSP